VKNGFLQVCWVSSNSFGQGSIYSPRDLIRSALILTISLSFLVPNLTHAVTIYAKVSARIIPALSANVVNALNFGDLASGDTPGEIIISANGGHRSSSGGAELRNSDPGSPAEIHLIGARNMTYSIDLPRSVFLFDEHGYQMEVDGFATSANAGHLDGRGFQDFKIGGRLNVPARQGTGTYSGILPVVVNYN